MFKKWELIERYRMICRFLELVNYLSGSYNTLDFVYIRFCLPNYANPKTTTAWNSIRTRKRSHYENRYSKSQWIAHNCEEIDNDTMKFNTNYYQKVSWDIAPLFFFLSKSCLFSSMLLYFERFCDKILYFSVCTNFIVIQSFIWP